MPVDDMEYVTYINNTPRGKAGITWKNKDAFSMDVIVPVGSEATVYIPAKSVEDIDESNTAVQEAKGVEFLQMENEYAVFEVSSGEYSFSVKK